MQNDSGNETDYDTPPVVHRTKSTKRQYGRQKQPRRILPKQISNSNRPTVATSHATEELQGATRGSEIHDKASQRPLTAARSTSAVELGKRGRRESSWEAHGQDGSLSDVSACVRPHNMGTEHAGFFVTGSTGQAKTR